MGVHGLWDLLAPVGRRVSVETLAGKRLAIDASIWMIQFMKAMRDEKGEMVRNAHLIGFFRRICKLLFLRTKPVFVFDGGTPALKRRTVIARRRQRENAQAKIRKTAEKLLMNHLKAMRLKNLAEDLKDQRVKNDKGKGKEVMVEQYDTLGKIDDVFKGHNQEMIDEMLAASMLAEECDGIDGRASTSKGVIDLKNVDASAFDATFVTEDEDDEDDEEMIMPITDGNVDPAVLASLPPSMQIDLLVQMREKLMAENRQKYQKVKKAPRKFSELQIEAYLKTVAFRREIDEVQRAAAGKGVAGVRTSRIASEANREFIFSSSFSGDKQILASAGPEKNPERQQRVDKDSSLDILNALTAATKSKSEDKVTSDEHIGGFGDEVQTFLDEKGRMRVSRRRAMGIRMTRDLERNIDLMKELESETNANDIENPQTTVNESIGLSKKSHRESPSFKIVGNLDREMVQNNAEKAVLETEMSKDEVAPSSQSCINISFDDDGEVKPLDADDEFFSRLVAGNLVNISSAENSASDCEWEEGIICKDSGNLISENKLEANSSHALNGNSESDVEWEEGTCPVNDNRSEEKFSHVEDSQHGENTVECREGATDIHKYVPESSANAEKAFSKGSVEEEAALQEAIRRSLQDLTGRKTNNMSPEMEKSDYTCKGSPQSECRSPEPSSRLVSGSQEDELSKSFVSEKDGYDVVARNCDYTPSSADMQSGSATPACSTKETLQIDNMAKERPNVPSCISGADSLHVTFANDPTENKKDASMCNPGEVSDSCIGRGASVMEEQASHTDVNSNMAREDFSFDGAQIPCNNVEISASKDEDIFELVGASLDDELLMLGQEFKNLGDEQRKLERNADSVNAEMFVECQELLQMFGLPYIIAPMEAEAQCAYMELANLVDGVVTDDSDVFLFGARSVYKNIFDDRKYVETYFMKDIESELGLTREKLIRMALLLGSDYTEGVSGIGIVNAIEVVNAFPEEDGLCKFREWVESPDPAILGKIGVQAGSASKRRGSKTSKSGKSDAKSNMEGTSISDSNASQENEDNQATDDGKQVFMDKHRNVSKNWHIPASFPSDAVITAYTAPQVDKSTEPFAWGKPDIFLLRKLCWEKFGWASQKADELLLPVLKEYNKRETQLRLEAFYTFNEKFAKIRSKRIKQALKGITGKRSSALASTDDLKEVPEKAKRRKASTTNDKSENEAPLSKSNNRNVGGTRNPAKQSKSQQKRRKMKDGVTSEGGSIVPTPEPEERRLSRGGGSRVRGRRKANAFQRSTRKEDPDSEVDEPSIHLSSSSGDELEHEHQAKKVHADNVRRSKRARKDVNYADNDEGIDEPADFPNGSQKRSDDGKAEQNLSHSHDVPEANIENCNQETQLSSEDPLPRESSAGDYLVMRGGFCAEEDEREMENNQIDSIQKQAHFPDDDKDYLQMGGGFCVEEDEEDQDEAKAAGNTVEQSEPPSPDGSSDTIQGVQKAQEVNPSGQNDTPQVAENKEEDAPRSVSAFSAIPLLKRKRRKN